MSTLLIGAIILVLAAVAIWQAPKLLNQRPADQRPADQRPADQRPADQRPADDPFEAKVRRLLMVRDLIKELDAVGAKGAVSKLRGAASMIIDEDFFQ